MKPVIKLSKSELQSGLSRIKSAENLILQLPENHDGRNTWLVNYGTGLEAEARRKSLEANNLENWISTPAWESETDCLGSVN